jgi:hypothetical protein
LPPSDSDEEEDPRLARRGILPESSDDEENSEDSNDERDHDEEHKLPRAYH